MNIEDIQYYINLIDMINSINDIYYPYNLALYVSNINDINLNMNNLLKINYVEFDKNLKIGYIKIRASYSDEDYDDHIIQVLTKEERLIKKLLE